MGKITSQVESHNSLLTNREMAILSSQIDMLALTASQTMGYANIQAYFYASEHYYLKLHSLIDSRAEDALSDEKVIESVRKSYYDLERLIEANPNCRSRQNLKLLLQITKDFYFKVREALQKSKYYFRVMQVKEKGLSTIPFYDNGEGDELESTDN